MSSLADLPQSSRTFLYILLALVSLASLKLR